MSSHKNRDDEIYESGVHDGQKADAMDRFAHSLSKGYTLNPRENDIYNKGYDYGVAHPRPNANSAPPPSVERSGSHGHVSQSSSSSGEDADFSWIGALLGLVVVYCVLVSILLSPGLLFNYMIGRFKEARYFNDFFEVCMHDGLTWAVSLSVWACIIFSCYRSKKFLRAFICVVAGTTVGWIVGFFIGLNVFGDYSAKNWGTWSVNDVQMGKIVDSSCIPAAIVGALLGFALFPFWQAVAEKKPISEPPAPTRGNGP